MKINKKKFLLSMAKTEMSMGGLCEKAGVNRVTLYRALSDKQKPMPSTIGKLARGSQRACGSDHQR